MIAPLAGQVGEGDRAHQAKTLECSVAHQRLQMGLTAQRESTASLARDLAKIAAAAERDDAIKQLGLGCPTVGGWARTQGGGRPRNARAWLEDIGALGSPRRQEKAPDLDAE